MSWRVAVGIGLGAWLLAACESEPLSEAEGCGELGRAHQPLTRRCFNKDLDPVADPSRPDFGHVPCRAATVALAGSPACECVDAGLVPADEALADVARAQLASDGDCQDACCDSYCFCELPQLSGADLEYCWDVEAEARPFNQLPSGWCYVEPASGFGNPELVTSCPSTQQRLLRTVPDDSWYIVLVCQG